MNFKSCIADDVGVFVDPALKFGVFNVAEDSAAFNYIRERVALSLPDVRVKIVQRIYNQKIWRSFLVQKENVADDNGGNANARLLFHGANRETLEKIVGSTLDAGSNASGFKSNFAGAGAYNAPGCGAYFAEHAIYPVRIYRGANTFHDVTKTYTFICADVICGDQYNFGTETEELREAPEKAGGVYDSVCGSENSIGLKLLAGGREEFGLQHVLYHDDRAYPSFVVTISPPDAPPLGVPVVIQSRRHHTNLQNAGTVEDASAYARAANTNTSAYEKMMIVRAPDSPQVAHRPMPSAAAMPPDPPSALRQHFGIMSLKHTPYTFLRVLDDDLCRFDVHQCHNHEQFSIELNGFTMFFVSKKNGKTIQAEENKTAKTANTNRRLYEEWHLSLPGWSSPKEAPPGLLLGTPVVIQSVRFGTNLQNSGTAEDKSNPAIAANTNEGSYEKLMIVHAPENPQVTRGLIPPPISCCHAA